MNILVLGNGGREHVFAHKIKESKHCDNLFIAPGNAGTGLCGTNIDMAVSNFEAIGKFCIHNSIHLLIPGGEEALVAGISDYIKANETLNHIMVLGPSKLGATLEGSKDFSKEFMQRHQIPTAAYQTFSKETLADGKKFLTTLQSPYVLKADGLAAGKGVLIIDDLLEAQNSLEEMLNGMFGSASSHVVIEEFLHGIEMSCFILTDGKNYKILPEAKDYKRIGEGDTGLNTGGMGAISPVPFANTTFLNKVKERIIIPTIKGLEKDNIPYCGFIFIGLMNLNGEPFVIEYNVRMGDPETEVVFPRINNDCLELFIAACKGNLNTIELDINNKTASTVFLVSKGYPENAEKGFEITGLENMEGSIAYHAGTILKGNKILTNGGRVIAVSSMGENIQQAVNKSFQNAERINYEGKYYRKDIGKDLIKINEQI